MNRIYLFLALLPFFISCTSGYTQIKRAQTQEKNITIGYNVGNIIFMKSKLRTEAAQSGVAGIDKDAAKEAAMNAKDGKDLYPNEVGRNNLGSQFKEIPSMIHNELSKTFADKSFTFKPVNKVMGKGRIKMMEPDFSKVSTSVFYFVDVYCLVQEENNSPTTPVQFNSELNCETSLRVYQKQKDGYDSMLTRAIGRYKTKSPNAESSPVISPNMSRTNAYIAKTFGAENTWAKNLKNDTAGKLAKVIGKIQAAK